MSNWLYLHDPSRPNWLTYSSTTIRVLLGAFFIFLAYKNLSGDAQIASDFRRFGYGDSFRTLIGGLQLAGGLILLWPGGAWLGALTLSGVMAGAVYCHFRHDPIASITVPFVFLVLTTAIAWLYRPLLLR